MPDYSILSRVIPKEQDKSNPIMDAIMMYHQNKQNETAQKEASILKQAQLDILKTQGQAAQKELELMPQLHQMKLEQHKNSLAAQQANIAATKQGMGTEALRQKQLQQAMQFERTEAINKITGGVLSQPPEKQAQAWKNALNVAGQYGLDTKGFPQDWNEHAHALAEGAYIQSGRALEEQKARIAEANIPLEKVIDPTTGQTILMPRHKAEGMAIAPPPKGANDPQNILYKAQINNYIKTQDALAIKANSAEDIINNTNAFMASAKGIPTGTGPGIGYLSTLSSAGQEARKYAGKLAFSEVKTLGGGVVSNADLAAAERNTLSLQNSMQANEKIAKTNIAIARRVQEQQAFFQEMSNIGIYDTAKMQKIWTKYINENPIIDKKTGEVNEKNINNWQPYLTGNTEKESIKPIIVMGKDGRQYRKVTGGYELI